MTETRLIARNTTHLLSPIVRLDEGTNRVGRDPTCNVCLSDPSVSRFHAEILVQNTAVSVRDLNSRNGTYIAGKRVELAELPLGQPIQFGCVQLQIENSALTDAELETQSVDDVFQSLPMELRDIALSAAERRVFDLILSGLSEKEVAYRLEISPHTVHAHVKKIYEVLEVRSRAELLARFIRLPNGNAVRPTPPKPTNPDR